jgi:HSP20 family protein
MGGVTNLQEWRYAMALKSLIPIGRNRTRLPQRASSPFAQFTPFVSLQREIDRLFDSFTRDLPVPAAPELVPSMDVTETDKEIELTVEVPGLDAQDVEINLADDVLTIRGEKKAEKEEKDMNYWLVERTYGSFERQIALPPGVNPDSVKANVANGVLKITIPKPAQANVKKIEVKSAA